MLDLDAGQKAEKAVRRTVPDRLSEQFPRYRAGCWDVIEECQGLCEFEKASLHIGLLCK